jgi:hypothetical protein
MFFEIYNFIKTNALNIENIIFIILLHPNYPNSKQPTRRELLRHEFLYATRRKSSLRDDKTEL